MPRVAVPLYRGKPNKSAMCQYAISTMGKKYCEKDVVEEVKYLFDQTVEVTDVREAKKRVRKNASNYQKTNGLAQPENIAEYKQDQAPTNTAKPDSTQQPLSLDQVEIVIDAAGYLMMALRMIGKEGVLHLLDEMTWLKGKMADAS
jgi:membrane carboxypeptidase/penicillin-binding protein